MAVVGRDPARVRETAEFARESGGGVAIHEHVADLAQLAEVRRLAGELREAYPRIDVLANNAGAIFTGHRVTSDGFEQTFALNHLAPFLLTNLLLERLVESGARVVTTSSDAHRGGRLDLDDLEVSRGRFRPARRYSMSKLCNVLFTRELQRRVPEVTAVCFHPGVIRSGFGKNGGALARISMTVAGPFMSKPEKGGALLTWLALDPAAAELRGAYVEKYKAIPPSKTAQDDALAQALWERSAQLTGVGR